MIKIKPLIQKIIEDLEAVVFCNVSDEVKRKYIKKTINRAFYWGKRFERCKK